jgi:phosphate transport system permease protein
MPEVRSWSRVLATGIAMAPVGMLATVVAFTVVQSAPALWLVGLPNLFGSVLSGPAVSSKALYGLLPPIWGTLLVAFFALAIAVPPSLALGLLATEFPCGPLTRHTDFILGTLGGVPPIIYAILGQFVVETFMRPKFAGEGITTSQMIAAIVGSGPDRLPATLVPDAMPNSVFLGGTLIGLLIIPYITPLVQDAIKGVPPELREASYGLGASRWYTTTRIVLPGAAVGIVTGVTLGTLRAVGEVEIAFFCIGSAFRAVGMPIPPWDVFEMVSPLPSAGAGLLGGIGGEGEGGVSGQAGAVASFTGFLLLVIAAAIVVGSAYLQRTLARRTRP